MECIYTTINILIDVRRKKDKSLKAYVVESLTQYYTHTEQWDKIIELLEKGTNKETKGDRPIFPFPTLLGACTCVDR